MDVKEAIKKRRTIRRFKQQEISGKTLESLIDAARVAPSGMNIQPLEFIVVTEKDILDGIFPLLGWAGYLGPGGPPPEGKRPVCYIAVIYNKDIKTPTPSYDAGAAVENILLLATSEGVGTCWIGSVKRKELASILNLPYNYEIDSVIALGYPDESSVVEEFEGSIKYWKDADGKMHVPKRNIKDILHFNKFFKKT
ncbi:MAG: nitroreductase family protein [Candidatus Omnitrophica bacterium]|nr:nitroreductase family protein [Candidatus Omnitrophota bacterium]